MSNLKAQTVANQLEELSIRFKERSYTDFELATLSASYLEDLVEENVSENDFLASVKLGRKRWTRFPTVKDLLDAHAEVVSNPRHDDKLQLEEMPSFKTPEQLEKNKKEVAKIIASLVNKK